ncbi:MAG: sensor histidine kinase [Planctomycetaceae bacterium]
MFQRSSFARPIILAAVLLPLIVALLVIWVVDQTEAQRWVALATGVVLLTLILFGVVIYFYWTIREVSLSRRQANFLDAVTHELKSPIASLKLCLQTLDLRRLSPGEERELHRFMLEDIQRLDGLIDDLLTVARLGAEPVLIEMEQVSIPAVMQHCIDEVCRRHQLDPSRIETAIPPCLVRGRQRDLEVVFLNLLDNAVKYGGSEPRVVVDGRLLRRGVVVIRISDNGEGVEYDLRRKIFQRFYRGGSELERTTKGTGLGLHIVKSLLARMRGTVSVSGRGPLPGATFVVELPGTLTPLLPASGVGADGQGAGEPAAAALGGKARPSQAGEGGQQSGLRPAEVAPATGRGE